MNTKTCEWPGCSAKPLCVSGNVGGALVCKRHFRITNGKTEQELSIRQKQVMASMIAAVQLRKKQAENLRRMVGKVDWTCAVR